MSSQSTLFAAWGMTDTYRPQDNAKKCKENLSGVFGDKLQPCEKGNFRCATHNINNIPQDAWTVKSHDIANQANGLDGADIRMWQEIGLYWPKLKNEDKWHRRLQGKNPMLSSVFGYNTNEPGLSEPIQPGGTAVIAGRRLTPRLESKGVDPEGLGRWAWMRFGDNNKRHSTFISVYRPCKPSGCGISTTYEQHCRHLKPNIDPREAILIDLAKFVIQQQELGDTIIIGTDLNQDINSKKMKEFASNLSLHNSILSIHGNMSPATSQWCSTGIAIDALLCSSSISPVLGGYAPNGGSISDHSWLWADFKREDLFGSSFQEYKLFVNPLNSDDPRLVKKYNDKSLKLLIKEKIPTKLKQLDKIPLGSFSNEQAAELDQISLQNTKIRLQVSSNLRHIYTGGIEWSPEWKNKQREMTLWRLLIKRQQIKNNTIKGRVSLTQIRRLMKATNLKAVLDTPLQVLSRKLKDAVAAYRKACKEAPELREKFMNSLDEARSIENNTTPETEKKKRAHNVAQKEAGRALARLKKKSRPLVSKVYSTTNGVRIEHTTKEGIEKACIMENMSRFSQVNNTPPMHPEITEWLGFYAESDAANRILSGTEDISKVDDRHLRILLEALRMPDIIRSTPPLSTLITLKEHRKGWKKQKKKTCSEKSQLGFTDYKAAAFDKRMAEVDRIFRQLPYRHGISLASSQKFTDLQILKKAAVYDVEKMRTIQLMPAAFNMNNKKTGREFMAKAEALNLIPKEQAGSRKGHRSNLTALNKVISNDLIRARRIPSIIIFNDAKSCYDRVVHWVAALALRRLGASKESTLEMMKTLQHSSHAICTAYGVSETRYGGRQSFPPLQGSGQGNGAGPAIWVAVSAVLITILRNTGMGLSLLSALSFQAIVIAAFAFVDDTDLIHTGCDPYTSPEVVLEDAQTVLNLWEGTLRATGGAIGADDPNKAFWYFLDFKYTKSSWKYKSASDLAGNLKVKNSDGRTLQISRLEPSIARETLGVFLAMDGNQREQTKEFIRKAKIYADQLRTGTIDKKIAWYSYTSSFSKTLEYPMDAIDLSEKEWESVLSVFMGHLLQKSGFASSFPRKQIFSPIKFHGLGLKHPYYLQQIVHLKTLVSQIDSKSHTGSLLRAAYEECRIESGCKGNLTDIPLNNLECITPSWIKNLIRFLINHDITLVDNLPKLPLQRDGDIHLMNLCEPLKLTVSDIYHVNSCRLFLNVTTLADITSADGCSILPGPLNGNQSHTRTRPLILRRQPHRNKLKWTIWKKILELSNLSNSSHKLYSPLGQWSNDGIDSNWKWFYSPICDELIAKHNFVWMQFKRVQRPSNTRSVGGNFIKLGLLVSELPRDLIRADIIEYSSTLVKMTGVGQNSTPQTIERYASLENRLANLPPDLRQGIELSFLNDDGYAVASAISNDRALAISDGSLKHSRGTSAFIIEDEGVEESRIHGSNRVPGHAEDQSSFRSEIMGVLGIILLAEQVCIQFKVDRGSVRIGLDGQSAVHKLNNLDHLSPSQKSYDLLAAIKIRIKTIPFICKFFWVKGHQDSLSSRISYEGSLNIMCDHLAKSYWKETKNHINNHCNLILETGLNILIEGSPMTCFDVDILYSATYAKTVSWNYWKQRTPIGYGDIEDINWTAIEDGAKYIPKGKLKWLAKHLSGFSSTSKVMQRRGKLQHANCPRCLTKLEDSAHVLICRDKRARITWKLAVQELISKLETIDTDPAICHVIKNRLLLWPKVPKEQFKYEPISKAIRWALRAQDDFGWIHFIYGRLVTLWEDAQKQWIVKTSTRWKRSSRNWSKKLVIWLIELPWLMWENRNIILHDNDHPWEWQPRENLKNSVRALYTNYTTENYRVDNKKYFAIPLNKLLEESNERIKQWIKSVEAANRRFACSPNSANTVSRSNTLSRWLHGHTLSN